MGNDSIIAFRTREQLRKYLGIFSPQFRNSRWKMEFLGQMLFGIQASWYGSMPVRLPAWPDTDLHLVVVKWPGGERPMMLLTTLNAVRTRKALWEVVQGYLTRWRVEDTIRYIKQSYRLEHLRLLDYQRLKNMAALVVAVAYFAAAWLGKKVKLDALAKHVAKVSRKMFEVPEFFYYAIADGLRWLFVRHGRWRGWNCPKEACGDLQMEFELLSG